MSDRLVRLKSYDSSLAADAARVALEHEGIAARLDGVSVGHALNHVGTALGGVGLLVNAGDAERAAEIIAELAREAELGKSPWYCGRCREDVEASFDVCWSCGGDRAAVEANHFSVPNTARAPRHEFADDGSDDGSDDEEHGADPEVEAMIGRAWRASILGIVFLPILMHLYSMWLLLRASIAGKRLSAQGSRKFYQAFAIDIFAGCAWGCAIKYLWL